MPSMIARWERFPNPRTSWGGWGDLVERLALIPWILTPRACAASTTAASLAPGASWATAWKPGC
jgi:hypothetical protein